MIQGAASYPLEKYGVFASSDIDEAIFSVSKSYCSHNVSLQDGRGAVNARHNRLSLKDVSLNFLQYGTDVAIDIGPFEEFYMLEFPLSGLVYLEYGDDRLINRPGTAALISPDRHIKSRWSGECSELMIKINRHKFESCLCDSIGTVLTKPLEFTPLIDLATPSGRTISEFVTYLVRQADDASPMLGFGNSISALEKTLFNLLLTCQPHNYSDALAAQRSPAVPYYVVKAKQFIVENLKEEFHLGDVAAACGVTERALYDGFKRFLGVAPYGYIRNLRLEHARRDFKSMPGSTSVTDIALKWGFSHLGRFSKDYYLRFGEKPSETRKSR